MKTILPYKIILLLLISNASFSQTHTDSSQRSAIIEFRNFTTVYLTASSYGLDYGVQTTNGIQISPYFYIGLGIGYDTYKDHDYYSGSVNDNYKYLPLFLNIKAVVPLKRTSSFISLSYGREHCIYYWYYRGIVDNPSDYSGNFFDAAIGFSLPLHRSLSLVLDMGYKAQSGIYYQTNLNSGILEMGIAF